MKSNTSPFTASLVALALAILALSPFAAPRAAADGGAVVVSVIAEEGGRLIKKTITDALKSWKSEHTRYYPDGDTLILPLKNLGGSRASFNFNHKSWVPRGSQPVEVQMTIHGLPDDVRDRIKLVMKADKQGREDRDRSGIVKDGSTFTLRYGTRGDRAYYFVERESQLKALIPEGAYIKLVLVKK